MISSKRKGNRVEREIVALHTGAGVHAERVPLSGSAGGSYSGDIVVDGGLRGEIKARKTGEGFRVIEKWIGDKDLLFLRRDRQAPLVCMNWDTYLLLLRGATEETEV